MRIAVISPHAANNGNTTLAMLIAMELASAGKLTCLAHVRPVSNCFYRYLNFKGFEDKTSTPSQIVKILRDGSLTGNDARAYCKDVGGDLEAFTNRDSNFTDDDMNFMLRYIAKSFPHENVVFDVDDDDLEKCKAVIKLCDVVILNLTQSIKELEHFKDRRDEYMAVLEGKPLIKVINRYMSDAGTIKEVEKWMGLSKSKGWLVLHYNPFITWATNHGKLNILFRNINSKDPRVIELRSDLTKICTTIMQAKSTNDKKKGGGHK